MLVAARGIIPLLLFALWVYCVLDVIATDSALIQNLPKLAWVFIVILFPPIGPIAWLLLGRPSGAGFSLGGRRPRRARPSRRRQLPPDDRLSLPDPGSAITQNREEILRRYYEEKRQREEEARRREEELQRGDDPPDPPSGSPDAP